MSKLILALSLAGVLILGLSTATNAGVVDPGGGGVPIEPDCTGVCPETTVLPNGTVCHLAGCVSGGGDISCIYACFRLR